MVGKASPCHSYHKDWGRGVCGSVHGDDFVFAGSARKLKMMAAHIAAKLKVKIAMAGLGHNAPVRVLNRSTRWTPEGIAFESDNRDADRRIDELELKPKNVVVTSALRESWNTQRTTSGGVMCIGSCTLQHGSPTQATIALSSAEAELNSATRAMSEAKGLNSFGQCFGESLQIVAWVEAQATSSLPW